MAKVLMFHSVLPEKQITLPNAYASFGTLISTTHLEQLLKYVKQQRYLCITQAQLTNRLQAGQATDDVVVLTFDDGYADNYAHALPLLERYGVKATFFPVTNPCQHGTVLPLDHYYEGVDLAGFDAATRTEYISGPTKKQFYWASPTDQWQQVARLFPSLPHTSRVQYMTPEQLWHLVALGHEVGSHGVTHALHTADYMNEAMLLEELEVSKHWLQQITAHPITSFCPPAGRYNERSLRMIKEAGYTSVSLVQRKAGIPEPLPCYERIFMTVDELAKWQPLQKVI